MQSIAAIVLLVAVAAVQAQFIVPVKCPPVQLQQNVDLSKIYGTWYEARRYETTPEDGSRCNKAKYSASKTGALDIVFDFKDSYGDLVKLEGTASYLPNKNGEADFSVLFKTGNSLPYSILSTDYKNFVIFYRCVDTGKFSARNVWIMTKKKNDEEAVKLALRVLKYNNIDKEPLIETDQTRC